MKRSRLNRIGKKGKAWNAARRKLKREFSRMEITTCELRYPGCWVDNALSYAHGKKRRKLEGGELKTLTLLSCIPCHERIERMPHEAMLAIVQSVISEREMKC